MKLEAYLETSIEAEKNRVREEEQSKLNRLKTEYEQKLAELQRTYEYEVEQEIQTRVNRELFTRSRNIRFSSLSNLQHEVTKAYVSFVPELLEHTWFTSRLEEFLSTLPEEGYLTVSGVYANQLAEKLPSDVSYGISEKTDPQDLGRLISETVAKRQELDINTLLNELKDQTLPRINAELYGN